MANLCGNYTKGNSLIYKQTREADKINIQISHSTISSSSTNILSYTTHPQAVYTSRLLDFKNLPEPKNTGDSLEMGNWNPFVLVFL